MSTLSNKRFEIIQQALSEAAAGNDVCVAVWQEADSDAGYVIATDGRMANIGEYQFGFTHIDNLKQADPNAAHELRQVSGAIMSAGDSLKKDVFPFDASVALPALLAWSKGNLSDQQVAEMLDLLREGGLATEGQIVPNAQIELLAPVHAKCLLEVAGHWCIETIQVGSVGQHLPANIYGYGGDVDNYLSARVNLPAPSFCPTAIMPSIQLSRESFRVTSPPPPVPVVVKQAHTCAHLHHKP